ncbi:ATP-binding protein [Virgisporangium aurantiacum]|uniref:IstB-like ATP-binding domain-containing protein n=1 Tax=Virgisporangium aurantiacum TaxID=175570 RepID=A0A8J4E7B4_9ACTN|nr:hypothetical protein Vau01_115340 [Virgisporangium aurantiacum]
MTWAAVTHGSPSNWITRLAEAHHPGRLEAGHLPFDHDAANLFFQLIASRYEQGSVMVTSSLPFGRWGETFSDDVVATVISTSILKYRL